MELLIFAMLWLVSYQRSLPHPLAQDAYLTFVLIYLLVAITNLDPSDE